MFLSVKSLTFFTLVYDDIMWQVPKVYKHLFGEGKQLKSKIRSYNQTFHTIESIESKFTVEQLQEFNKS